MADVFSQQKRSEIMALIKGKDTKPERIVRSILHRMGYRFRLHVKTLPGKPDIVLTRYRKIVFVNGCFWHGHKCRRNKALPKSNTDFWSLKIAGNRKRDRLVQKELEKDGWRVLIVWECETKSIDKLISLLDEFLTGTTDAEKTQ